MSAVVHRRLEAADWQTFSLHTPPGTSHELIANEETVVLVVLPQAPVYE